MCWSGEASAVLATIGLSTAAYTAVKKMPPVLWLTLGYFSLMELLQAFTYTVINSCSNEYNQILTLFGYLHICFQPFFINAISLHFLPNRERARWVTIPSYAVCFTAAIIMLLQLYPFTWAGPCILGEALCAADLCSVSGNWHIAWNIPLNGLGITVFGQHIGAYIIAYAIAGFVMPLAYGVWRGTVFHLLLGPTLAWLTTDNMNEWPAVWCLLSIGIIMLVIKIRTSAYLSEKLLRIKT